MNRLIPEHPSFLDICFYNIRDITSISLNKAIRPGEYDLRKGWKAYSIEPKEAEHTKMPLIAANKVESFPLSIVRVVARPLQRGL